MRQFTILDRRKTRKFAILTVAELTAAVEISNFLVISSRGNGTEEQLLNFNVTNSILANRYQPVIKHHQTPRIPDQPGSYTVPRTWEALTRVILGIFMPANCVMNAQAIIDISSTQERHETIAAYGLRYRTLCTPFSAEVAHAGDQRIFWPVMHVTFWKNGIRLDIQALQ